MLEDVSNVEINQFRFFILGPECTLSLVFGYLIDT